MLLLSLLLTSACYTIVHSKLEKYISQCSAIAEHTSSAVKDSHLQATSRINNMIACLLGSGTRSISCSKSAISGPKYQEGLSPKAAEVSGKIHDFQLLQ